MKDQQTGMKEVKKAVLFAISFVLAVIVYRVLNNADVSTTWKLLAISSYGVWVIKFFSKKQLVAFAGFCMLMVAHNYVWLEVKADLIWKIATTVVVLLQFSTLGDKESAATSAGA
ncbi:MAG: hypothetical protein WDO19_16190 [Bacteroidota bacterium]